MSREEINSKVHDIIAEAMPESTDFSNDDSFFALGITSISIMQIQLDIAKSFKVKLNFRELSNYCSVNKLSEYLEQKIAI